MLSWKDHLRLLLAGVSVFGVVELATPSTALAAGGCRTDYCTNTRCTFTCMNTGMGYICNYGYWVEGSGEVES